MKFPPITTAIATVAAIIFAPPIAVAQQENLDIAAMAERVSVVINGQNPGSGAIVGKQGNSYFVLTAKHVVATEDEYQIVTPDGQQYPLDYSRVRKLDNVDLAVVEFTSDRDYEIAIMGNSEAVKPGEIVYVAGWPHPGQAITERIFQLTAGILSARSAAGTTDGYEFIYTNITRSGMSGGPVLDRAGKVIGIHGRSEGQNIYNPDTGDVVSVKSGFNLAIPLQTFIDLSEISQLPFNPSFAYPLSSTANIALQENRVSDAIAFYEGALKMDPEYWQSIFGWGQANYEAGDGNTALERFKKAAEFTQKALDRLKEQGVIELEPYHDNINTHFAIATTLYASGDREAGLKALVTLMKDNNDLAKIKLSNPDFWSDRLRTDAQPLQTYAEKILATESRNFPVEFNLGQVLYEMGKVDEAISYFQQVLDEYSNDPRLILALATALEVSGNRVRSTMLWSELQEEESELFASGEFTPLLNGFWGDRLFKDAQYLLENPIVNPVNSN